MVGRRDLFRLPEDLSQDIRIKKHQKRQAIVKQKSSLIAKLTLAVDGGEGLSLDFNLAGTQLLGMN